MHVHSALLSVVVCPRDRGHLHYVAGRFLYNPRLRLGYPIVDGIPVLEPSHAQVIVDEAEHKEFLRAPRTDEVSCGD